MKYEDPFDERTIYTIVNVGGANSTITLDKLTADVLQMILPDVHQRVQQTFDLVCERRPHIGRREQGDWVRALANEVARKSPEYTKLIDEIL
jgi:hypothetical protein